MAKNVAFFNETTSDIWVSISGGGVTVPIGVAVSSLATAPTSDPVFQQADANSVIDACANLPTGVSSAIATFKRSDLSTYDLNSNDFISGGSRPPNRPH